MTTVGYGDMTPKTLMGRMIALATFLTGLILFAVFARVVGSAITDVLDDEPESE
ncbi:potassium channel family protein [Rubripirellula sp.]|nr:potassium channel family protein [Rubripirellula sp.]